PRALCLLLFLLLAIGVRRLARALPGEEPLFEGHDVVSEFPQPLRLCRRFLARPADEDGRAAAPVLQPLLELFLRHALGAPEVAAREVLRAPDVEDAER